MKDVKFAMFLLRKDRYGIKINVWVGINIDLHCQALQDGFYIWHAGVFAGNLRCMMMMLTMLPESNFWEDHRMKPRRLGTESAYIYVDQCKELNT